MPHKALAESTDKGDAGLGASARASVLWGGGFTVARDVAQFAGMLVLVRLLSAEDYGTAALAQSITGLLSVVSFGTFLTHALQLRNFLS
jgi:O-antigen/teichoic acid export membrane protein